MIWIFLVVYIIVVALMLAIYIIGVMPVRNRTDASALLPVPEVKAERKRDKVHIHKKTGELYVFTFIVEENDPHVEYLGIL